MSEIVTVTLNPSVDKSAELERVVPDRKLRCDPPSYEPGGGGINVARIVRRLGGDVEAIYAAGGFSGRQLDALLHKEVLGLRMIPIQGETRQNLAIYERSAQQQFRFGMPGPRLSEEEWRKCLAAPFESDPPPRFVVASGSLPPGVPDDFYARMAERAAAQNIKFIVDCTGEPLRLALKQGVFLVKPNIKEFHDLIGEEIEGTHLAQRARAMVDAGRSQVVVVSMGSAGALVAWKGNTRTFSAPTVKVQSKIGAGDSTLGGLVLALSRNWALPDAVRLGLAAGAAAVMTPGSQLAKHEDIMRLFEALRNDAHTGQSGMRRRGERRSPV
jgi:6-phosphofructokinase 2